MAASRKPPDAPDEPTERDGRALKAPAEKSTGRGRGLKSPSHHLVAEGTGSGPGLELREAAEAGPRAPPRHAVPSEVTAGRGVALALALSSSEEVTARGPAVKSPPPEADGGRHAHALREAATAASRGAQRQADTQDDTKDLAPSPRAEKSSSPPRSTTSAPKTQHPTSAARSGPQAPSASTPAGDDGARVDDEGDAAAPDDEEQHANFDDDDRDGDADDGAALEGEVEAAAGFDDEEQPAADFDEDDDEADAGFDDDEELPGAPPDSDDVAARALAVAALLQRALHEARPNNASEVRALQSWVDAFGLYASFGPGAFELFDAPHGAWAPEDRAAVLWTAEELRLLLWALGVEPALPSTFERSEAKALVKKVPLLEPPQAFLEKATVRNLDDLEVMRAFYEVLLEATTAEVWARSVLEDPAALEEDDDELQLILESAAESGNFDRAALEKSKGKAAATAAGLRAWSRQLISSLFESGSPHAALAFDPGVLEAMSEQSLANAFATVRTRAGALEWLTEGDEWDLDGPGDEAGQDAEGARASADDEDDQPDA
ncbi:MAG: DUF4272 domain-containing protein [Myxococcota bacterium]